MRNLVLTINYVRENLSLQWTGEMVQQLKGRDSNLTIGIQSQKLKVEGKKQVLKNHSPPVAPLFSQKIK